jgi:hypothetical protein
MQPGPISAARCWKDLGLHARNELQLPRAKLTAQEAVDVQRLFRVDAIDHGQRVEWDFRYFCNCWPAAKDFLEGRLAAFVHAKAIMQLLRTIDAQPDQEFVLAQKSAPLVVQQQCRWFGGRSRCGLARPLVFLFQRHHFLEEAHAQQRRLAPLPGEHDFVAALASMYWRMCASRTSSLMRNLLLLPSSSSLCR